jgi:hypothetical protein
LSEALVERQLGWASRGPHWHTRWISWGSLALHNKSDPTPGQAAWSPVEGGRDFCAAERVDDPRTYPHQTLNRRAKYRISLAVPALMSIYSAIEGPLI